MTKVKNLIAKFRKDEDGASFLEYTVLLGIILAGTITTFSRTRHIARLRSLRLSLFFRLYFLGTLGGSLRVPCRTLPAEHAEQVSSSSR